MLSTKVRFFREDVEATSGKFARRPGCAVIRADGDTLRFRFSHDDTLVRVYWRRNSARSAE